MNGNKHVALHEAGHALVSVAKGIALKYAVMFENGGGAVQFADGDPGATGMGLAVSAAGMAAEEILTDASREAILRHAKTDLETVGEQLRTKDPFNHILFDIALREARRIIRIHAPHVITFARRLETEQYIDGRECVRHFWRAHVLALPMSPEEIRLRENASKLKAKAIHVAAAASLAVFRGWPIHTVTADTVDLGGESIFFDPNGSRRRDFGVACEAGALYPHASPDSSLMTERSLFEDKALQVLRVAGIIQAETNRNTGHRYFHLVGNQIVKAMAGKDHRHQRLGA